MERSRKVILLAVAMLFITLSSNISAQGYRCNDDNYGAGWWNTNLPSQYQLSTEQIAKLNKYRADIDQKIIPLQSELRTLQIEMRRYVNLNDAEPAKTKDYRNQIRDIQDKITDIRLNARKEMSSVLTKNQQVYFNDSRVGWWNNFYDRCGWDYEDMTYNADYRYNGRSGNSGRCW